MPSKKQSIAKQPPPSPDSGWTERINALRSHLKLSRPAFAKLLGSSVNTLAAWEEGIKQPSSSDFLKLGNIAGEPSCWYFWEHAGMYSGEFMRVLPAVRLNLRKNKRPDLQVAHAGMGGHLFSKPQLRAIPLLPIKAATHGHKGDKNIDFSRVPPEGLIAAPSHWAPNPAFTCCLRVQGESMSPVLGDGYIIAIDTSITDLSDLMNKMVVSWHKEKGITVSWLKMLNEGRALVPESPHYGSIVLSREKGWRVIAKVIWWIGRDG